MSRPDRFVGVLGWPLDHTLSPVIHNAAFRSAGLDWVYLSWPVPPNSLEAAVMGLRALGATGANVTMPHKQPVIDFLDELSDEANDLGAVNTIHRRGQRLTGHNTDVTGFREFRSRRGCGSRRTDGGRAGSGRRRARGRKSARVPRGR
jgi:shikimate dehydrogenase